MKGLIIYSGGMDSTTLLHEFKENIAMAISFNYGSKHNAREIEYAAKNCQLLGIPHKVINLDFVNEHFKSSLLQSGGEIPEGHYAAENMKSTVVPFRNAIMLSIAVGIAESHDLDAVYIANHFGDHAIYPDCRASFINAFAEAAEQGTYNGVKIISPYCNIDKRAIALRGKELGVDFSLSYSCYKGGEIHCGKCGTCVERKEALEGFDNTKYEE